jgi:hypothetical protein
MPAPKNAKTILGVLSFLVIVGLFVGTMWPFQPFPPNEVRWLSGAQGIRVEESGVVLSRQPLSMEASLAGSNSCSVEIWVLPTAMEGTSTIMDFYHPGNPFQFMLRQYEDGLIVSQDVPGPNGKLKRAKIDLDHGLRAGQLTLITLSTSEKGTLLYLDGVLKESYPKFRFTPRELLGQIILGTSPVDSEPWMGEIRGLGFYASEESPAIAQEHYEEWRKDTSHKTSEEPARIARYEFREGQGQTIRAQDSQGLDLWIPSYFFVPHKAFLKNPVKEFNSGWAYWSDVIENILVFIPLGLFLCSYFAMGRSPRLAIGLAILAGFAFSLSVESIQAYLPQRVSDGTDVITDTLGTALGAFLARSWMVRSLLEGGKV